MVINPSSVLQVDVKRNRLPAPVPGAGSLSLPLTIHPSRPPEHERGEREARPAAKTFWFTPRPRVLRWRRTRGIPAPCPACPPAPQSKGATSSSCPAIFGRAFVCRGGRCGCTARPVHCLAYSSPFSVASAKRDARPASPSRSTPHGPRDSARPFWRRLTAARADQPFPAAGSRLAGRGASQGLSSPSRCPA